MTQPIQPLAVDEHGVLRFKPNAIVRYLLDHGGIDLNHLALMEFSADDRMQFAQLIGYSLSGFGDLSYASNDAYDVAAHMAETGVTEEQARIKYLTELVEALRDVLRAPMAQLFGIHPDDLGGET